MRNSGSPRIAYVAAQAYIPPTAADGVTSQTGWSATAYASGAPTPSSVMLFEGFGAWSVYIIATAVGNNELKLVVKDENDSTDLSTLTVSSAIVGAATYQHFFIVAAGSTLPVVLRKGYFTIQNLSGNAGAVTMRLMGRAS